MIETMNIEAAQRLQSRLERLEIFEAIVLAIVIIATAWSGYQAARWEGDEQLSYVHSTEVRVKASREESLGGEQRLLDQATFNTWLQAKASGHDKVSRIVATRFSPEFAAAFDAWIATDPLADGNDDAGPAAVTEYHNALTEDAARLDAEADDLLVHGEEARRVADDYVRITVFLATVLFLVAIGQRFRRHGVRVAMFAISVAIMSIAVFTVVTLPRV